MKKRKANKYQFIYFDPNNPTRDKIYKSSTLKGIKKKRQDIVGNLWQSRPSSVPIMKIRKK